MSYVWEEEYIHEPRRIAEPQRFSVMVWHLKKIIGRYEKTGHDLKVSVAHIYRLDERKYRVVFQTTPAFNNDNKTFRSLKAAKAYALAIITLEQ